MTERLQKILSQWGIASRRQAEQMIRDGRVRLNGEVVLQLGQQASPDLDRIEVDGQAVEPLYRPATVYLLLHKPVAVVSTCHDPWHRSTVLDLLPESWRTGQGIHPVGRLDYQSTGALLLTNDGALTFGLTHPRHHIAKTYRVWVQGQPPEPVLQQWRQGVLLSGKRTLPAEVQVVQRQIGQTLLHIILHEGRNRQIRKVAEQLGHPVVQLHRTAIGAIQLASLPEGHYRCLTNAEIRFLRQQINQTPVHDRVGGKNVAYDLESQTQDNPPSRTGTV
ncbi:pseudouridine synthase [Neosynechococcus sphagnicola]|uniref:pseudouridine synthase n=1 Tax=Neosynechococcus sphagnicola TaxID=1501145 RepID=UPI000907B186|nr:pseudouridine synthase [Neosynechococcus sphagnicola]